MSYLFNVSLYPWDYINTTITNVTNTTITNVTNTTNLTDTTNITNITNVTDTTIEIEPRIYYYGNDTDFYGKICVPCHVFLIFII